MKITLERAEAQALGALSARCARVLLRSNLHALAKGSTLKVDAFQIGLVPGRRGEFAATREWNLARRGILYLAELHLTSWRSGWHTAMLYPSPLVDLIEGACHVLQASFSEAGLADAPLARGTFERTVYYSGSFRLDESEVA